MKSTENIEGFLIRMEVDHTSIGDQIWLVNGEPDIVISINGPVVVFRVKLLEQNKIPAEKREKFYETLLQFNASEMLHGAYGLEEGSIVATDALQLENLDYNEFVATMEDLTLTVGRHYPVLSKIAA